MRATANSASTGCSPRSGIRSPARPIAAANPRRSTSRRTNRAWWCSRTSAPPRRRTRRVRAGRPQHRLEGDVPRRDRRYADAAVVDRDDRPNSTPAQATYERTVTSARDAEAAPIYLNFGEGTPVAQEGARRRRHARDARRSGARGRRRLRQRPARGIRLVRAVRGERHRPAPTRRERDPHRSRATPRSTCWPRARCPTTRR